MLSFEIINPNYFKEYIFDPDVLPDGILPFEQNFCYPVSNITNLAVELIIEIIEGPSIDIVVGDFNREVIGFCSIKGKPSAVSK